MPRRDLGGNAAWNLAGIFTYAISQWAVLIVLAKAGSPAMVGQVALGLAISTPVFIVLNLGLRQVLATDARTEYPPNLYLKTRIVSSLIGLVVVVLVSWALSLEVETARVVGLVGLAKGFDAISELCYGMFQRVERLDHVGRSLIIRGVVSVSVVAVVLSQGGRIEVAIGGWALARAAVMLAYDLPLFARNRGSSVPAVAPPDAARALIRLSLPLGFAGMIVALNLNTPRYFLAHYHDEALLGLFAAAANIPMSGRRLLEAVGQAIIPRLANLWAQAQYVDFRRLLGRIVALGSACAGAGLLVVWSFGGPILELIYTEEYALQAGVFLWLMGSWGLRYPSAFLTSGLVAARKFQRVPWVFLPSLAAAIVSGALLIPRYGILGAAWADMISAILQLVLTTLLSRDLFTRRSET